MLSCFARCREAGSRVEELELGVDLLKGIGCC